MNCGKQAAPLTGRWASFLLNRPPAPRADGEVAAIASLWQMPLLALVICALAMAGTGAGVYLSAKRAVTQATHDNLAAIASLKVGQIEHWQDRHRKDVQAAIATPLFTAALQHWLEGEMRDKRGRAQLLAHLQGMALAGGYANVGIRAATDGALLLSTSDLTDTAPDRMNAMNVAKTMQPLLDDLHFSATNAADIGLDFYFPLNAAGMSHALAVVVVQDRPADFLFPLLSRWPGPSPSAETLIFKADSDKQNLVYLNNPRHRANAALLFRLPVAHPQLLSAQAARGQFGSLTGVDYRAVPSLGYALPVTGTAWIMMAKLDAAEAYAALNTAALYTAATSGVLLLLAAWWFFVYSRHAEARYCLHFERQLLLNRLDFLSRHANDAMILSDLQGAIIEANDRALALYGYAHEEMTGLRHIGLCAPYLCEDQEQLAAHERRLFEAEILHKNGQAIPVEICVRIIEIDGTGYLNWIVRDITERRSATIRIQRLSRLKAAISATNQAIIHSGTPAEVYRAVCAACVEHGSFGLAWVGLADAATQQMNPIEAAGPATGYLDGITISTCADVPEGQGPSAIAYRGQREYICNDFSVDANTSPWRQRATAYGLHSSISLPLLRGGHSYGTLNVYGTEKHFFDAESVGLLGEMAQNISFAIDQFDLETQRRQAEHELRQSEEKFRTLVEHLPQGIFVKNIDSVYVSGNTVFARDIGTDPAQIAGKTDYDFFPPELAEKYRGDDRRVMQAGEVEEIQEEYRARGQQKFIHTIKVPFRNVRGEIVGVLGVFGDITARKQHELKQAQQARRIEELSRRLVACQEEERRRLARELHERASPNLAAIKISLRTLAGVLPHQMLGDANACLEDVRALLDDTTAGIRAICADLRPTMLDYAGLIPALKEYAAQFTKRAAAAVHCITPADAVRLDMDTESALFRIAQEALTNCLKHACAKTIKIELAHAARQIVLTIKDDGIGFTPDEQLQSGNTPGLGLITMQERAEFIGGKFSVTSHPMTGTEIRVELEYRGWLEQNRAESAGILNRSVDSSPTPDQSAWN